MSCTARRSSRDAAQRRASTSPEHEASRWRIGLLSLLNQLVNDLFLPSNTLLGDRNVSLGLGKVVLLKGIVHGEKALD
jgi:hypothetical protein